MELLDRPDPSEKFDQNRQATNGRYRPQRVTDFDLSVTKKSPLQTMRPRLLAFLAPKPRFHSSAIALAPRAARAVEDGQT